MVRPLRPFRILTEERAIYFATREARDAAAQARADRDGVTVPAECWDESHPQDDLNRGWACDHVARPRVRGAIEPAVFDRLLDQARTVAAFMVANTVMWPDEDDRDDELRVADFIAWRAGYTSQTSPTFEDVVSALHVALVHDARRGEGTARVDQQPEYTE